MPLKREDPGEWSRAATHDLIRHRIKIKSLNFMRGRTFLEKFLIIDEAPESHAKQMKTLITRAGPGTKVVCMKISLRSTRLIELRQFRADICRGSLQGLGAFRPCHPATR